MLFNSIDFAIFLPIVFTTYWFILNNKIRLQNLLIVVASYIFYGWWDWKFLSLILFSTIVDYSIGLGLLKQRNQTKRKILLWTSILTNIGFLAFFKYYNFFLENFTTAFSFFGTEIQPNTLNIILPVGISFYTFQTLSYSIDVYKRKIEPTKDFIAFSAFVSFFPQLVAGPIERATNLLPQFYKKRTFDYSKGVDGLRQILWGLFKKIVIADNCGEYANLIFNNYTDYHGSTLVLGAVFFSFQIYGDFSGYSDIAIGTSRLFGFDLMKNFAFPYFSRDVAEFWRRWHISLSTWFRDYVYIPLGGNSGGKLMKVRNTFLIFVTSGLWHGANWTFVLWGGLNALYFLPLLLTKNNRNHIEIVAKGKIFPSFKEFIKIILTFSLTTFAWIFFRSENIYHSVNYIERIFNPHFFSLSSIITTKMIVIMMILLIFITTEWMNRDKNYALQLESNSSKLFKYTIYIALIVSIAWFRGSSQYFIYFQF